MFRSSKSFVDTCIAESHLWKEVVTDDEIERPRLLSHTTTQIGFYLFIIGGHNTVKYTNDVRLLNLSKPFHNLLNTHHPLTIYSLTVTMKYEIKPVAGRSPGSRGYHGAIHFDNRIFILGGYDGVNAYSDVWMLDLASQSYLNLVSDFNMESDDVTVEDEGTEAGTDTGTDAGTEAGYEI